MGAQQRRKRAFLNAHQFCAFCGGSKRSTSIEHCPPRALFPGRIWPEGFEFPSCDSCNRGSSGEDLLVAWLARIEFTQLQASEPDREFMNLLETIRYRHPGLLDKMIPTTEEDEELSSRLGILPLASNSEPDVVPVHVPSEFDDALSVFSGKLLKGVYYQEVGLPFPSTGCIIYNWFTNAQLFTHGNYPAFESLRSIPGKAPTLRRQKTMLSDRFEYKVSLSDDNSLILLQARFGASFGVVACGSSNEGYIESYLEANNESSRLKSSFSIIQSPEQQQQELNA